MSRKTKPRRSIPSRHASSQSRWNVNDAPVVEKPLSLVCGACGASGRYHVGTVTIDPTVAKSPDKDGMEQSVGFTGYFRCQACDAGGPWELPGETLLRITAMTVAAMSGMEDVPLIFGATATFDGRIVRYATDAEVHLKKLIKREPERAFLWVRLGNLYSHAGQNEHAQTAYERAIELDAIDIEAHSMLGQLLVDADRGLEAVPHFHAVLQHARDARLVNRELKHELVRGAIECLLEAHAESNGQIDLLPAMNQGEMRNGTENEPVVVALREFDLGTEEGIDDLCDMFIEAPSRRGQNLFRRRKERPSSSPHGWRAR